MKKKLWGYFLLAALMPVCVCIYTVAEIGGSRMPSEILAAIQAPHPESDIDSVLSRFQKRIIGMLIFSVSITLLLTGIAVRQIMKPISETVRSARQIAEGNLTETVPVYAEDEIGNLAKLMNDLNVNLQEVLLHSWNYADHAGSFIEKLQNEYCSRLSDTDILSQIRKDIELMNSDIETVRDMVQSFRLYDIRFEEGKVAAGDDIRKEA